MLIDTVLHAQGHEPVPRYVNFKMLASQQYIEQSE